jgi:hypothetical protein
MTEVLSQTLVLGIGALVVFGLVVLAGVWAINEALDKIF